ncbi:hypothetical protein MMC15_003467 [Xylographa vitiligo]|nr:hypothetical protein [Xylographa vitiligo]
MLLKVTIWTFSCSRRLLLGPWARQIEILLGCFCTLAPVTRPGLRIGRPGHDIRGGILPREPQDRSTTSAQRHPAPERGRILQVVDLALASETIGRAAAEAQMLTDLEPAAVRELSARGFDVTTHGVLVEAPFSILLASLQAEKEAAEAASSQSQGVHDATMAKVAAPWSKDAILRLIKKRFPNLFLMPLDQIDEHRPMPEFGVDSMIASEFRSWFWAVLRVDLSILDIKSPQKSLLVLTEFVKGKLLQGVAKIFALLGVSTSMLAVAFPVDYTKSIAAIYTDFALYTMREDANMDIPSACCPPSTSTSCLTLPSWVPDWTKNHHQSWWKIGSVDRYNAASDVACSFCLGKDPNMLLVDGLLMSQVAHICPPYKSYFLRIFHWNFDLDYSLLDVVSASEVQLDALDEAMLNVKASHLYGEEEELLINFVLALTGYSHRRKYPYLKVEADPVVLYNKHRSSKWTGPSQGPRVSCSRRIVEFHLRDRGWVPLETAVGDQMAIFLGALAPMLLRPQNDAYLIVGESYIYEIMDGEALKDPSLKVETIKLVCELDNK